MFRTTYKYEYAAYVTHAMRYVIYNRCIPYLPQGDTRYLIGQSTVDEIIEGIMTGGGLFITVSLN